MARKPRACPEGVAQHVIQRGNNRQVCFGDESDFAAYAHWLREAAERWGVALHAWVFMTNHVHLLGTPDRADGVSGMMQDLGRRYVRHFNYRWQRSGTLWEGRFKSCRVQDTNYLLHCYRYIELNPVRARMVDEPAEYRWSSYQTNGLGVHSSLPRVSVRRIANIWLWGVRRPRVSRTTGDCSRHTSKASWPTTSGR